jgi:hypothetical protein
MGLDIGGLPASSRSIAASIRLVSSAENRIRSAGERVLRETPGQTAKDLALAIDEKYASVKTKLYQYKKAFISIDGKWKCLA